MERPTIEITLPDSGARVVLNKNLTNGEYRQIQKGLVKHIKINPNQVDPDKEGSGIDIGEIPAELAFEQQDLALKYLVKEVWIGENQITDVDKFVFDLSLEDGEVLYNKINELDASSKLSKEAKKK